MDGHGTAAAQVLERSDGAARICFAARNGITRLADLYQRAPLRVLSPHTEPGEPPQAVVVTTSGGLADGDRLHLALRADADSAAQITTQAAEKIYRAHGPGPARFDCEIAVQAGAWLEWLPQETILFDGAQLARRTRAEVAPGGRLLASEHIVFGRVARGESFTAGSLSDRWEVLRDERLTWCDALCVTPGDASARAADWGFKGGEAYATTIFVADDAAASLSAAREMIAAILPEGAQAGASVVNGVLLTRWLGSAVAVRTGLSAFIAAFRSAVGGYRPVAPRVWSI